MWLDVGGREKGEGGGEDRKKHHPMHGTYPAHFSPHGKSLRLESIQVKSPDLRCSWQGQGPRIVLRITSIYLLYYVGSRAPRLCFCLCIEVIGSRRSSRRIATIRILLIGIQLLLLLANCRGGWPFATAIQFGTKPGVCLVSKLVKVLCANLPTRLIQGPKPNNRRMEMGLIASSVSSYGRV